MCNLLIPLCPFVLHSVTTSTAHVSQFRGPSDAQVLFSYLSKNSYAHLQHRSRQEPSHAQHTQIVPLAQRSTKLYKRTIWHTCSCFFRRVVVLHPMPGPSRPTFGMAYKPCKRCSDAAKTIRPMRMGGIGDKADPYWNRCIFAGARGVLENGFENEDENAGGRMRFSSEDVHGMKAVRPTDVDRRNLGDYVHCQAFLLGVPKSQDVCASRGSSLPYQEEKYGEKKAQSQKDGYKSIHVMRNSDPATLSYGEDLDRYLAETYDSKLCLKA